jgi:hypothetical protein
LAFRNLARKWAIHFHRAEENHLLFIRERHQKISFSNLNPRYRLAGRLPENAPIYMKNQ